MVVRRVVAVACVTLVAAPVALADYGMTVRKTHVRPGDRMTIWGSGCRHSPRFHLGMRIYLVAVRHVSRNTIYKRRPPGPPFHFLGRFRCTHTAAPQPWGDGGYWTATLTFRVPCVSPGRYRLFLYCLPCRKGAGGNLIANNTYFDGQRRRGPDTLVVTRR
jgi:hypothetical protein